MNLQPKNRKIPRPAHTSPAAMSAKPVRLLLLKKYPQPQMIAPNAQAIKEANVAHKEMITAQIETYREKIITNAAMSNESQTGDPRIRRTISQTLCFFLGVIDVLFEFKHPISS